jgi:hypothetical protein
MQTDTLGHTHSFIQRVYLKEVPDFFPLEAGLDCGSAGAVLVAAVLLGSYQEEQLPLAG